MSEVKTDSSSRKAAFLEFAAKLGVDLPVAKLPFEVHSILNSAVFLIKLTNAGDC